MTLYLEHDLDNQGEEGYLCTLIAIHYPYIKNVVHVNLVLEL